MASFVAWPLWEWLTVKAVSASLQQRTKALVERDPKLQPAWTIALQDGVLTLPEAKVIVEAAGEKVEPSEE
jgi:hypothetical protein